MASKALHLLVSFSLLLSFIHLPSTKARHLLHEVTPPEDTSQEEKMEMMESRMDFEINRDYTGSGANNRHTPNPPVKQ
ncbi:hypothetical protein ACS0TY_008905 [Phlomoides rotata]